MFQRRVTPAGKRLSASAPELLEARFRRFLKELHTYERHLEFQATMDGFLDLYSTWKRTQDEFTKLRLVMLAFELHRLDGGFECDLDFSKEPGCGKSSSET